MSIVFADVPGMGTLWLENKTAVWHEFVEIVLIESFLHDGPVLVRPLEHHGLQRLAFQLVQNGKG